MSYLGFLSSQARRIWSFAKTLLCRATESGAGHQQQDVLDSHIPIIKTLLDRVARSRAGHQQQDVLNIKS